MAISARGANHFDYGNFFLFYFFLCLFNSTWKRQTLNHLFYEHLSLSSGNILKYLNLDLLENSSIMIEVIHFDLFQIMFQLQISLLSWRDCRVCSSRVSPCLLCLCKRFFSEI